MSSFLFGGGSGGFESSDPKLGDKIAALKRKRRSSQERVTEFLEQEMHVDPRELPFTVPTAHVRLAQIAAELGADVAAVNGNSLGLKSVVFQTFFQANPVGGCALCGDPNAGGYWVHTRPERGDGDWMCYACNQASSVALPDTTVRSLDHNDHGDVDWHDLTRCWNAFVAGIHVTDATGEQHPCYSFFSTASDSTEAVVTAAPDPDVTHYLPGCTLRIQKAVFRDGDVEVQRQYVRVGGLWSDDDIVTLDTLTSMKDLTGWTVVEVL